MVPRGLGALFYLQLSSIRNNIEYKKYFRLLGNFYYNTAYRYIKRQEKRGI